MKMDCADCGQDTIDEYYSLHDELWCQAILEEPALSEALRLLHRLNLLSSSEDRGWREMQGIIGKYCRLVGGFLCIGCLETRLGRRTVPDDFDGEAPINTPECARSDRLWSRLTGLPEDQRHRV